MKVERRIVYGLIFLMGILVCASTSQPGKRLINEVIQLIPTGPAFADWQTLIGRHKVADLLRSAEHLAVQGDYSQAIESYQEALRLSPHHLTAQIQLAELYMVMEAVPQAEAIAKQLQLSNPKSPESWLLNAKIQSRLENTAQSLAMTQRALSINPDFLPAVQWYSALLAQSGDRDKAQKIIQQQIDRHPEEWLLRAWLSDLHINNQSLDQAEQVLRQAVDDFPQNAQPKTRLLDFLARFRSAESAEAEVIPMLEYHPDDLALRIGLVNLYLQQTAFAKAESALEDIIQMNRISPYTHKAYLMLARLKANTGDIPSAKAWLQSLLSLQPEMFEAMLMRGELALAENQFQVAISDFEMVLKQQPHSIAALIGLATAYEARNDDATALLVYEKILRHQPEADKLRLHYAELLATAGQTAVAVQQLELLLLHTPDQQQALETLGKIQITQQQIESAQKTAERLQHLYPKRAGGYYLAGLADQSLGLWQKSAANFSKALQHEPDAIEPLIQLINNYLHMKQIDTAVKTLQKTIAQQPGHFIAYNLLGGVYSASHRMQEAVAAFKQAIHINREWDQPYRNLAALFLQQHQPDQALAILQLGTERTQSAVLAEDLTFVRSGMQSAQTESKLENPHLTGTHQQARLTNARPD